MRVYARARAPSSEGRRRVSACVNPDAGCERTLTRSAAKAGARSGSAVSGPRTTDARSRASVRRVSETLQPDRRPRSLARRPTGGATRAKEQGAARQSFRFQMPLEAVGHPGESTVGLLQGRRAGGLERVELLAPAAALSSRLAVPRFQQAFLLEAVERRVDGVDRDVTPRSFVDFLPDRGAVGAIAETQDAEQDQLFEIAERAAGLEPHCGGYDERIESRVGLGARP